MDFQHELEKFSSLDFHPNHFICLSNCLKHHEECGKATNNHVALPKRLIDLGSTLKGDVLFKPKLCLTQHIEHNQVKFVAISHSWSALSESEKLAMITTKANENERCIKIELHSLPPNYQALMVICRSFGFQYLWLDSMCILQDDSKDWEEESLRMKQVYGVATLTTSLNTSQNLFTMARSKEPTHEWELLRHQSGTLRVSKQLFQKRLFESGIVGTRAWCLQERHLSHRLLHLLDNGVVLYECTRATWSTNAPQLFDLSKDRDMSKPLAKLALARRFIEIPSEDTSRADILISYWYQILVEYQNRTLTFNDDNLTALAGIAEMMQAYMNWTFLSGIWRHDVPRGMLWESMATGEPHDSHKRFKHFHAPSWSWSSVDGPSKMAPELIDNVGEVVVVRPQSSRATRRGSSMYCSLVSNVSIKTPCAEGWGITPLPKGAAFQLEAILLEAQCRGTGVQRNLTAYEPGGSVVEAHGTIHFDVPSEADNLSVFCLPLVTQGRQACLGMGLRKIGAVTTPEDWQMEDLETGEEAEEESRQTFQRLGFVRLTLTDGAWVDYMARAKLVRVE